ncbi:hypothetical protein [Paenibacillus sp. F4]|uniref:hypothetical protein n=1 Tax=Paenibacillus sp. F4 TaxID=357385 RepID=UPI000C9F8B88|nr:hypothetical protein [Paenibacillus sp. F4]PNQ78867.1 hypothetical protein C1T21_22735 [Paenibacillus sp. F4]
MKKVLTLILLVISLTIVSACSSAKEEAATPTLDDYVKALTDVGAKDQGENAYALVNASSGKLLALGTTPIQIVEYDSVDEAEKALKEQPKLKKWSIRGKVLYSTKSDEAKKILDELK